MVLFPLLFLFWAALGQAAVLQVGFEGMVRKAKLIFEGEVIDRRVVVDPQNRLPFTEVTFAVHDLLKGDPKLTGRTVTLRFLGGRIGGITLSIPGMDYPEVGERGIYFVRDPEVAYPNPLFGWHQGHFLIRKGLVYTAFGQPVVEIEEGSSPPPKLATDEAAGVVTGALTQGRPPLSLDDFKERVRRILKR